MFSAFLAFPQGGGNFQDEFSYAEFEETRKQTTDVFSDEAAYIFGGPVAPNGMTVDGTTEPIQTVYVSGSFFSMLGIAPHLGRFILPSEGSIEKTDPVVVLSYRYWQSRFGGNPSLVGKTALINGHPVTIVGIAPRGFLGVTPVLEAQAYLPLSMVSVEPDLSSGVLTNPKTRDIVVVARMKAGVRPEKVQALLGVVSQRLLKEYPRGEKAQTLQAMPLRPPGILNGPNPMPKLAGIFMTLAGLVLLLACANVANLFIVRATERHREMTMRAALGAARLRLVRQLLTESLLLAGFGCAGGLALGLVGSRLLSAIPFQSELPIVLDFDFDWRVFVYAVSAAVLCGILVGIVPALRVSANNLGDVLHEGGRTSTGRRQRLRSTLVGAQIGGSLLLLIVAGLFVRSLQGVERADLGFDPQHVLNVSLDPQKLGYTQVQGMAFYRQMLDRVGALPGVESVSVAAAIPLGEQVLGDGIAIPGYETPKGQPQPSAELNAVSSGYFKTMRMVLLRGRAFSEADNETSPHVAVIDKVMAERFWLGHDPLGRQFTALGDPSHPITVIGIVKNSRMNSPFGADELIFFVPVSQRYFPVETLQIRTAATPQSITSAVLDVVRELAPTVPVFGVRTMTRALHGINGLLLLELGSGLALALGLLAFLLAIVGVYGVMSYSASQRTKEIGIRIALGARPNQITRMICRQCLVMIGAGVLVGLFGALAVGHLVGDFLVNIAPTDAFTYVVASSVLCFMAFLATYIPARRAAKVDPMVALRYE